MSNEEEFTKWEWLQFTVACIFLCLAVLVGGIYVLLAMLFCFAMGGLAIIVAGFSSLFNRSRATVERERREEDGE